MKSLIHVIYVSSAASIVSEHDTLAFVNQARIANRQHDVSGMMLYLGGHFVQLLEGEPSAVDAVSAFVFADQRAMRPLLREPIVERAFPEWTMGFEAVQPQEACRLLGDPTLFDPVTRAHRLTADNAKTLLTIIGRRRWQSDRSGMFRAIRRTG